MKDKIKSAYQAAIRQHFISAARELSEADEFDFDEFLIYIEEIIHRMLENPQYESDENYRERADWHIETLQGILEQINTFGIPESI